MQTFSGRKYRNRTRQLIEYSYTLGYANPFDFFVSEGAEKLFHRIMVTLTTMTSRAFKIRVVVERRRMIVVVEIVGVTPAV